MPGRPKRKAVENTEIQAKRARGETDLEWGMKWRQVGTPTKDLHPVLCLDTDSLDPVDKAAGFDIDFTIISTQSGRKFATGTYHTFYITHIRTFSKHIYYIKAPFAQIIHFSIRFAHQHTVTLMLQIHN